MSETLEPALPDQLDEQAERLMRRLCDKGLKVATAESCTGGMLAALLTDIEGAGHAFDRGFVTYTKDAKFELLGIDHNLLDHNDAVSETVALPGRPVKIGKGVSSSSLLRDAIVRPCTVRSILDRSGVDLCGSNL